jgi:hypothetical protein
VVLSASGSWTVPAGVAKVVIEAWAGGGGGGSAQVNVGPGCLSGGGGGQGGYGRALLAVAAGDVLTITIGTGGAPASQDCSVAGTSPVAAGPGTPTIVSRGSAVLVTANGGSPGQGAVLGEPSDPGIGGTGGSATFGAPAIGLSTVVGAPGSAGLSDWPGGPGGAATSSGGGGTGGAYGYELQPTVGMPGLVIVTPVS